MKGFILPLCLAAALALAPQPAPAQQPDPFAQAIDIPLQRFPTCCPRPEWWDAAGEVPRVHSLDGFLQVWQDKGLTAEQKAKALFQAIEDNHQTDDDITAPAITYIYYVARSYPYLRELTEFGVRRYLDYDRPMERYSGKPGDLSGGLARNLAEIYIRDGEPERAVPVLRHILGPRRDEVNGHTLQLAAITLGQALEKLGRGPEAVEVLIDARRSFDGSWEERIDRQLAQVADDMGPAYYLYDTRISGPVALIALALLLALGIFRRRRPRLG